MLMQPRRMTALAGLVMRMRMRMKNVVVDDNNNNNNCLGRCAELQVHVNNYNEMIKFMSASVGNCTHTHTLV